MQTTSRWKAVVQMATLYGSTRQQYVITAPLAYRSIKTNKKLIRMIMAGVTSGTAKIFRSSPWMINRYRYPQRHHH